MSTVLSEAPAEAAETLPAAAQTAGTWLRQARQAQGLHIAVLAAQLKVPQAKLEALEADRYQELTDATFVRALAKAMCRVLKIDAAPVLALLPSGSEPGLERVSKGLNQPFRERAAREDQVSLDWLGKPVVWGPLLLLLAALAVYLLPGQWLQPLGEPEDKAADQPVQLTPAPAPQAETAASAAPLQPPVAGSPASALLSPPAPAAAPAVVAPTAAATPAASVAAPLTATSTTPPPAAAPAVLGAGQVPLRVKASEETWVEVSDAQGQVLFSKLMRPGETSELGVTPPLRLRVGNVAGTEITLRGAAVDLRTPSRDNVARIELK